MKTGLQYYVVAAITLALNFAVPCVAGPLEDGIAAYDKGDYATALSLLRPLADQGVASAQYSLGLMYANGQGVPNNLSEAANWWRLAGAGGNVLAQFNLCFMYANGQQGVPQDFSEAAKWCQLAAAQGDSRAADFLGRMYYDGHGLPQDYVEAAKWYRLAAEQGDADAQNALGVMYANGQGVAQNDAEALRWFRLAADQGEAQAQFNVGYSYYMGRGVPRDYAQAMSWLRKAADQDHAFAQFGLGNMYLNGQGVPRDIIRAYMWVSLSAARLEDAEKIRKLLAQSMTLAQKTEAERLVREWKSRKQPASGPAAPTGDGTLDDALAAIRKGDYTTALKLFRPLADQGNPRAQFNLGFMYANGRGV